MSHLLKLLSIFLLIGSVAAQADCCSTQRFTIGAEALYLKPYSVDAPFAQSFGEAGTDSFIGEQFTINHPSDWGVYLFGRVRCGCYFGEVGYTRFEEHGHRSITLDPNLTSTLQGIGVATLDDSARAELKQRYQAVDIRGGSPFCCGKCGEFVPYAYLRWAKIDYQQRAEGFVSAQSENAFASYSGQFDGVGLGVGLEGRFSLFCRLGAHARLGIAGLIGDLTQGTATSFDPSSNTTSILKSTHQTQLVPAADCRVGLDYNWECNCFKLEGSLGYRLDWYERALKLPGSLGNDEYYEFVLGGLYFGLQIAY